MREILQNEFVDKYVNGKRDGIYVISVRFGKTLLAIKAMKALDVKRVLVCYPNVDVRDSWESDFGKFGWKPNVVYSTFRSLEKVVDYYDMVVIDEVHLLSEAQRRVVKDIKSLNSNILGLTGTLDVQTEWDLKNDCKLNVLERFSTNEAIDNNIIADFEVRIITYKVDNKTPIVKKTKKKTWTTTEKKDLNYQSGVIQRGIENGEDMVFRIFNRMRFINDNLALREITKKTIESLDRYILFGGSIKFIESLGINSHHSKSEENGIELFNSGRIDKLALCKLGNQGVTFKNLNAVIITNIDSNSENLMQKLGRSLIKEEGKISTVYIIVSDEEFQLKWLTKALRGISPDKIKNL